MGQCWSKLSCTSAEGENLTAYKPSALPPFQTRTTNNMQTAQSGGHRASACNRTGSLAASGTGIQKHNEETRHEGGNENPLKLRLDEAGDAQPQQNLPLQRVRQHGQLKGDRLDVQNGDSSNPTSVSPENMTVDQIGNHVAEANELKRLDSDGTPPSKVKDRAQTKRSNKISPTEKTGNAIVADPSSSCARSPKRPKRSVDRTPKYIEELTLRENVDELLKAEVPGDESRRSISPCIQTMKRPKRNKTRKPKYTDEIMLCDNIDDLVKEEIPSVDSRTSISSRVQTLQRPKRSKTRKPKYTDEIMVCENVDDMLDKEIPTVDSGSSLSSTTVQQRPKKKDSTRKPRYTDPLTLDDDIDAILEREIPNVDSDTSLNDKINEILSNCTHGSRRRPRIRRVGCVTENGPSVSANRTKSYSNSAHTPQKKPAEVNTTSHDVAVTDTKPVSSEVMVEGSSSGSSIKKDELRPIAVATSVHEICSPGSKMTTNPSVKITRGIPKMGMATTGETAFPKPCGSGCANTNKNASITSGMTGVVYNSDELKLMAQIEAEYGGQ